MTPRGVREGTADTSPAHGIDASGQEARTPAGRGRRAEERMVPKAEPRSYYGRAVVKEPVWTWEIPTYFFTGGLAGASAGLAFGAGALGNRPLARRSWPVALAGLAVSPLLLISDLGRPARFLNMLRVFKTTSPMSVGSWLLTAAGGATAAATAHELLGLLPRPVGRTAGAAAATLGLPLTSYTAVLLSNTAVPVWHEARRELPFVFAGSALASAGAMGVLTTPARHAGPARRLAVAGAVLEGAAVQAMERRLGDLGEPYEQGAPAWLSRASKALGALGAACVGLLAGRDRRAARTGAGMVLGGALLERWAVFRAGFASARDPKYTVGPQRERADARAAAAQRDPTDARGAAS